MNRAGDHSLPVPLSPCNNTVLLLSATRATSLYTSNIAVLLPTNGDHFALAFQFFSEPRILANQPTVIQCPLDDQFDIFPLKRFRRGDRRPLA